VNEDVLVGGLDHVVTLRAKAGHVTVNVDVVYFLDSVEHGIDDDEGARTTDASTAMSVIEMSINFNIYFCSMMI